MFDVGIITAPRKETYISPSLDSYFRTWDITPHVFCEPGVTGYINKSKVIEHHNERTLGCVGNWLSAVKYFHAHSKSPFVMMLEDDIEWVDDAKSRILRLIDILTGKIVVPIVQERLPLSKVGAMSAYCARPNRPYSKGWQLGRYGKNGVFGSLCFILPRHSVEYIVEHEDEFLLNSKNQLHLDYAVGKTLMDAGLSIITHNPTLVLHLGEHSTYENNNKPHNREHPARQPAL